MKRRTTLQYIIIVIVIGLVIRLMESRPEQTAVKADNSQIAQLFKEKKSGVFVIGSGAVTRILPDDIQGSKHQRIIVDIGMTHTILIAHNIDLAPRIHSLETGDTIRFSGKYEWNSQGGVVHWTHHDPQGRHQGGWIIHEEITYK